MIITITPTTLSQLGDPKYFANLKYVAVAGEKITTPLKNLWSRHVVLINKYGPTEGAIMTHENRLSEDS
ncbi:unnamed protein product, partial [Aphanomyces euteiches]